MDAIPLSDDAIYIVGAGAQSPVGRCVLAAAAAVRCGISAYAEHSFMIDKHGEPMVVAAASWIDESLSLEERVIRLASDAVEEALHPLTAKYPPLRREVRVHLALSAENFPDSIQRDNVINRIAAGAVLHSAKPITELVADGHAGGLLAFEHAVNLLRRGDAELCLVGGVDSYLEPENLEALDFAGRLHSVNHSWGFTPGEGAGFCLLAGGPMALHYKLTPLAEVLNVATFRETKLMGTDTICTGDGLTAAFRSVLLPGARVSHSYCDLNGETYRADEFGFAACRTSEYFEDPGSFTAAAECWGDVGAASGPLALALALAAWNRGYEKGPLTLVWSSGAAKPLRAAALLRQCAVSVE